MTSWPIPTKLQDRTLNNSFSYPMSPKAKQELATTQPAPQTVAATTNMENMLMAAVEKGLPVETIERLLAMRKDLKAEYAREEFFKAMAALQGEMPVIKKDKQVKFSTKAGEKVDYSYAPMDSIIAQIGELVGKHGFSYKFEIEETPTTIKVTCIATHSAGHSEQSSFTSSIGGTGLMSASQKAAGANTYGKRIAFCNVFGITTGDEDNDGNNQDKPFNNHATDEQKAEIDRLAQEAKLEKVYVTTRVREVYGVSYTELTKTQADGVIAMLRKRLAEVAKSSTQTA